jgi:hypothetical protein
MAIVPGSDTATITPTSIRECRATYVQAIGKATAIAARASTAVAEAKAGARDCRDQAAPGAQGIRCPPRGGCRAGCQQGRTMKTGGGLDWTVPVKKPGGWAVTATAYYGYSISCSCPQASD